VPGVENENGNGLIWGVSISPQWRAINGEKQVLDSEQCREKPLNGKGGGGGVVQRGNAVSREALHRLSGFRGKREKHIGWEKRI